MVGVRRVYVACRVAIPMVEVRVKRVYDPPSEDDGFRVLVDRLWPRGLSKGSIKMDLWLRDVAPSDRLRKWFGHDPAKWGEFVERYRGELAANPAFKKLLEIAREKGRVTLLYSARDAEHNQAVALKRILEENL